MSDRLNISNWTAERMRKMHYPIKDGKFMEGGLTPHQYMSREIETLVEAEVDKARRESYRSAYEAGRLKGKREEPEKKIVMLPWSSMSQYWNGDMFEDWLKSDAENDTDAEVKRFLRQRDEKLKKQLLKKSISHLNIQESEETNKGGFK